MTLRPTPYARHWENKLVLCPVFGMLNELFDNSLIQRRKIVESDIEGDSERGIMPTFGQPEGEFSLRNAIRDT